jgi:hypothetical protein
LVRRDMPVIAAHIPHAAVAIPVELILHGLTGGKLR